MAKGFDSAKLKQFLIERGEKIGLGVAVVLAGLLGYGAYSLASYEKKPSDLASDYETASRVFATSKLDAAAAGITLPPGKVIDELNEAMRPVSPGLFGGTEWNAPLFDNRARRTEPAYLALRDLRAVFKYAPINVKVGSGGAQGPQTRAVGEEWLTVTGLIPLEEQEAEYAKAFANAADAKTNAQPRYGLYKIQRAEVTSPDPNVPVAWDQIEPVDLKVAISDERAKWAGDGPQYVDAAAARLPVTQPLPPLANKSDLGDWAAHLPEIGAATVEEKPAAQQVAPVVTGQPAAADPFAAGAAPAAAAAPEPAPTETAKTDVKQKYLLFRFIDFNIEPTKYYRYRVKLVLNNPNYNLNPAQLEKPELAQGETREAEWSEPSPPAGVPVLERYFAGNVKSPGGDLEPTIDVAVKQWMPNFGADAFYEFKDYLRGALLNDAAAQVAYIIPGKLVGTQAAAPVETRSLLADFSWERASAKQRGPGSGLDAKPITRPSEVLLRTPRGELVITTQLGDWSLRDEMKAVADAKGAAPQGEANPAGDSENKPAPAGDVKRVLQLK